MDARHPEHDDAWPSSRRWPRRRRPTGNAGVADKAAKEFESVFISQFLGSMFSGISTDGPTGGGEGEEMFRSLMVDQYGKAHRTARRLRPGRRREAPSCSSIRKRRAGCSASQTQ